MTRDDRSTPEEFKGFVPRPAPANLRQKVLAAAAATRPAGSFLTSVQWGMAAVCVLLIIGALAGDVFISRTLAGRLDVLLNEHPAASPVGDSDRAGLEELIGVDQARSIRQPLIRPRQNRALRMEGRMNWDDMALEEKEDVDVHSKNPR
jgi:hypothetical protein